MNIDTWADDLQVIVLGFKVKDGSRISESQLLYELLSNNKLRGMCPHNLLKYQNNEFLNYVNDVLIPCGHLGPNEEPTQEDLENFTKLLIESKLDIFKKIQPHQPKQKELSPIQENGKLCLLV